jgi:hypothetical protein
MSKKILTINPWLTMWTRPRETIKAVVHYNPDHHFFLLSGIYGFAMLLQAAQNFSLGQTMLPGLILLIALILAVPIGWLSFSVVGCLILWCGKWIGGKGNFKQIRAALAWANITNIVNILMWLLLLTSFGGSVFFSGFPSTPMVGQDLVIVLIVFIVQLVATIWSIVLLLKALGEVQGFSAWKALLNVILPLIIIFVACWIITWIWNLVTAMSMGLSG